MRFSSSTGLFWSLLSLQFFAAFARPDASDVPQVLEARQDGFHAGLFNPPPTSDVFYDPPLGWQDAATGGVLKFRADAYPSIYIGNCINTYQVMYRTTDSLGNATWSTTTVFIPASHASCSLIDEKACSYAMVSYALPYDSCSQDGTPSYLLQFGEPYGDMYDLLSAGYFVNVPDYEGYNSSYSSGVISGAALLDATTAALALAGDFGFQTAKAKTALWGYSGGAVATEFAAELHRYYAPNLTLAGIAQGGNVANVLAPSTGAAFAGSVLAGLAIASIIGITSQHPAARAYINSKLKRTGPYNIVGWYNATTMTGSELLVGYDGQDPGDYFVGGAAALDNTVLVDMYLTDSLYDQHGVPDMPVYYYKAINDEQESAYILDPYIEYFCTQGANILYHRNSIGGHNQELFAGRPRALDFLSDVLTGTDRISFPATGCKTVNVTIAANVTLQETTAQEGQLSYPYDAVVVEIVDLATSGWTTYSNGSIYEPHGGTDGHATLITPDKRAEATGVPKSVRSDSKSLGSESLANIAKRWEFSLITTIERVFASPSVFSAINHRLDVITPSPWFSSQNLGVLKKK